MSLFRKFTETVSKGVSTATEKAQQTVEITRLHAQISAKRKEIERLMGDIGKKLYTGYMENNLLLEQTQIVLVCEQIKAIEKEIDSIENRLMELRNEKECACGTKLPLDARFCSSCGAPFPEPVTVTAEEDGQSVQVLQLTKGDSADSTLDVPGVSDLEEDANPSSKS